MKWPIIILLLSTLGSDLSAAEVIELNRAFSTGVRTYSQGIPREAITASASDSERVTMTQSSAGYYGIAAVRIYTDHFQTLADSGFTSSAGVGFYIGDHAHHTERHDTIIVVGPRGDGKWWARFTVFADDFTFLDSGLIDSAGQADSQGEVEWFGHTDSVIVLGRNPDDMDVWYWLSQNNGASYASQGHMYAYDLDTRVEIDQWGDSLYAVVFRGVTPFGYYFHPFGGTWGTRETISTGTSFTRLYAASEGRDKWVHVMWTDYSNPTHVIHARRDPVAQTWALDTPYTAPGQVLTNGGELWPALCFSRWDAKLRAFYSVPSASNADSSAILVERIWNYTTAAWGDPDTISSAGSDYVGNLAGCRDVPAIHHSRAYIEFNERVSGTTTTRHMVLADSAATEYGAAPPERNKVIAR
jgi:hypothetical protein